MTNGSHTTDTAPPVAASAAPDRQAPAADTGTPASSFGLLAEGGGFRAKLGRGLLISAEQIAGGSINLEDGPQPLPGVLLKTARYVASRQRLDITGDLAIPHVAAGGFRIRVDSAGQARIHDRLRRQLDIPALGNPRITVSVDEQGALAGELTIEGANLLPSRMRSATATGSGTLRISDGKMSGNGTVEITYADLGDGTVNFSFTEAGAFAAGGSIRITPPFLDEISGELSIDEQQNLRAEATVSVNESGSPIPGLTLAGGSITIGYENGRPSGSIADFRAEYSGLGSVTVASASIDRSGKFAGSGALNLEIPAMDEVAGTLNIRNGAVSGSLTIPASAFPDGLPISRGNITATLSGAGQVGLSGSVGVDLGPAGSGNLEASYSEAGEFAIGAEVDLTIPGLDGAHVAVSYANGDLEGEAQVPINTQLLPGFDGTVTVRFREGRWSGETELAYEADNGKLSGTIRITVAQTEEGTLELGGGGSVTAQLMPRLSGTLQAEILPEGGVDISGTIEVTEPLELFPERRVDRELFRYSQNIPLWAILVAVIRVRAGVRAGIGPGVFRNIRVEGSYTVGAEEADPSFTVSGEMFIPAFVEGYVAIGAGLGLDVLLGSLTGGIEAVGTAGLYGAISVVPELSYADGDWGIEGTATLAAGARLKLGLNAWAEVEALWVTVWSNEWQLAEVVMPVGPDLGLQMRMSYTFGQPEPPEIEMNSSDIDTGSLIQDAMPKDGPGPSGAREALQNRAEWQGALREQRSTPVPPEMAAEANRTERAPEPAQRRPPPRSGTPPAGANAAQGADRGDAGTRDKSVEGSVPESALPDTDQPRYPGPITLAMLEQPPAPMPRTRAQEQEDINAARDAVNLASRQAANSDALDEYFPRIKRRFGLSSLGYEGDFQRGFQVVGQINPQFALQTREPLTGTGIPGDLQPGHVTQIEFRGSTLAGDQVGIGMTARPLGPDHPQGSGPSGQNTLMGQLPTNPRDIPDTDKRYIRGHLLNDNLGGPGRPINLFPITAQANALHHSQIESYVKNWVNVSHYWTSYTVDIEAENTLAQAPDGNKYIDSRIVAEASVLGTDLRPVSGLTRRVTIDSVYNKSGAPQTTDDLVSPGPDVDAAALAGHRTRYIDTGVDVALSSRHNTREAIFPDMIKSQLRAAIAKSSRADVARRLRTHDGFGARSEEMLFRAYGYVITPGNGNDVSHFSSGDRGILTRIFNAWPQGLGAKLLGL